MLCLHLPTTDVYRNLATEEYLLRHATADFFLLWQSDNAIVIGKNQNLAAEVDLACARQNKIRLARRFSGGGAVYQDRGNLNLTFIENAGSADFTSYLDRVIAFLASIGIEAKADERLGITVGGLKVSGSAQCVHKNRVMYHCTLLFDTDLRLLDTSLAGSKSDPDAPLAGTSCVRAVPSVRSRVVNLKSLMPPPACTVEEFTECTFDYFLHENTDKNALYRLNDEELNGIEALRSRKYIQEAWTFHRSEPRFANQQ